MVIRGYISYTYHIASSEKNPSSDRGLFARSPSSVFGPQDSPISVGNDEFGIRMFAIGEQRRVTAAFFTLTIDTVRQQIQLRVRYRWRHRSTVESLGYTGITPRQHDTERNFRSSNNVPSPSLPSPSRGRGEGERAHPRHPAQCR